MLEKAFACYFLRKQRDYDGSRLRYIYLRITVPKPGEKPLNKNNIGK
jgi:hypothetical protein